MTLKHWILIAFGLTVLGALVFLPVKDILETLAAWADTHERMASLAFILVFVGAVLLMIPAAVLMLFAGFLFGLPRGVALVLLAYAVSAPIAFLIARNLARDWIKRRIADRPRFVALDRAVHESGFKTALLARLAQVIPYNLLNYAFGLTSIRLPHYLAGTLIGAFPAVFLLVLLGSKASSLTRVLEDGWSIDADLKTVALLLFAVILVLFLILRRIPFRNLRRKTGDSR